MACIYKRELLSGRIVWRVQLRRKGFRRFSLHFDSFDEAVDWIEKNEKQYYQNPEKFFKWKEDEYFKMQRLGVSERNHIIKTRTPFVKSSIVK